MKRATDSVHLLTNSIMVAVLAEPMKLNYSGIYVISGLVVLVYCAFASPVSIRTTRPGRFFTFVIPIFKRLNLKFSRQTWQTGDNLST